MTFETTKLPDAPIIVFSFQPVDDFAGSLSAAMPGILRSLEAQPEPVFVIVDIRQVSIDLDGHLRTAKMAARGDNPLLHHPKQREVVFVSADTLMPAVAKGLGTPTFGSRKAAVFGSLDEAIDYCYGKLGRVRGITDDRQAKAGG